MKCILKISQYFNALLGFVFIVLFLVLQNMNVSGQVILKDQVDDIIISGENVELLEDKSNSLKFSDLDSTAFFKPAYGYLQNINTSSTYWLKIHVNNQSSLQQKWVLETLTPNLLLLEVFIPEKDKNAYKKNVAGLFHEHKKQYAHKNYIFDLPSGIRDYKIYIKTYSPNFTGLEFKIRNQHFFTWYALHEYFFLGIYYGILLIMLVYNLLLYINNKEKIYLFYSIYVISVVMLSLSEDGLGMQFVWKNLSQYNLYFYYYVAPTFFIIASSFYARNFLNLTKNYKRLDSGLAIITGLVILSVILQAVFDKTFKLPDFYILPFIYIYIISMYIFRKGYKPARFFILGYTIVFFSLLVFQLRIFKIIEANIFTVYILNYGILLEVLVLSFALGERFKLIKEEKESFNRKYIIELEKNSNLQQQLLNELKEKNLLADKVNRELEQKVTERTYELQSKTDELLVANEKLKAVSQQLKEMNIKLDLDNWDLKKTVKHERVARIVADEITFEEFIKTFPDQSSCLRYLEDIKWGKGYSCIKCGNQKYSSKLFTRKCTRCNYVESPTSNTLYHGIKIPLNKAFYITYTYTKIKDKYTIDELANLLDIGKNTCWDFRKKIRERQEEKKKELKLKEINNWEVLIPDKVT